MLTFGIVGSFRPKRMRKQRDLQNVQTKQSWSKTYDEYGASADYVTRRMFGKKGRVWQQVSFRSGPHVRKLRYAMCVDEIMGRCYASVVSTRRTMSEFSADCANAFVAQCCRFGADCATVAWSYLMSEKDLRCSERLRLWDGIRECRNTCRVSGIRSDTQCRTL